LVILKDTIKIQQMFKNAQNTLDITESVVSVETNCVHFTQTIQCRSTPRSY